jgi:hypothetical protein
MLPLKGLFDDTFMQNQTRLSKLGLQNSKRKNLAIKSMFLVEIFNVKLKSWSKLPSLTVNQS